MYQIEKDKKNAKHIKHNIHVKLQKHFDMKMNSEYMEWNCD